MTTKPRIGVLLGDPNGIGPELAAKLLAADGVRAAADIVVIGDHRVFDQGCRVAGFDIPHRRVTDVCELRFAGEIEFLDEPSIAPEAVTPGRATAEGGRSVYLAIKTALRLAREHVIDAFCFAPMNKKALALGGSPFADEHELFAHELGFTGPYCEHNVLGDLWTVRVSSHIPVKDIARYVTEDRIVEMTRLADATLRRAGIARPRIAVCALNPHGGDGGLFGREEIDIIAPAVARARAEQLAADGPFPADTVFLKARDGAFDAVVTMYHDQGQIAMKLMGFAQGVTVSGGLPIPIATPASGTAFDIVGRGIANSEGMRAAFDMICRMATPRVDRGAVAAAGGAAGRSGGRA
ncbi:MAG: 4-hydroxythreonine-4-phosphate dehydrogenase PdxA [Alphaproteobacteria bacterium]|nr:4-hydroxythreonine-4-phosphate dehydrogenase PdxA [Alphaproteobacteria bacterium]